MVGYLPVSVNCHVYGIFLWIIFVFFVAEDITFQAVVYNAILYFIHIFFQQSVRRPCYLQILKSTFADDLILKTSERQFVVNFTKFLSFLSSL